jgi:hypothetical protein
MRACEVRWRAFDGTIPQTTCLIITSINTKEFGLCIRAQTSLNPHTISRLSRARTRVTPRSLWLPRAATAPGQVKMFLLLLIPISAPKSCLHPQRMVARYTRSFPSARLFNYFREGLLALVKAGAKVNVVGENGCSPLDNACAIGEQ